MPGIYMRTIVPISNDNLVNEIANKYGVDRNTAISSIVQSAYNMVDSDMQSSLSMGEASYGRIINMPDTNLAVFVTAFGTQINFYLISTKESRRIEDAMRKSGTVNFSWGSFTFHDTSLIYAHTNM